MKLYKVSFPGDNPQLVSLDTNEGPMESLVLGESGRGRKENIVKITGTGSEVRVKKTGERIVLVRGDFEPEERCLLVVNTVGEYDRNRNYDLFNSRNTTVISEGYKAFGSAGAINGGPVFLVLVNPGGEFRLNSKYSSTWYTWTEQGWVVETPEERGARLALKEVENGGGEWL